MTEDSKDSMHIEKIKKEQECWFLRWWEVIFTWWWNREESLKSHYNALKELYSHITTEYTFHMEDDRLFLKKDKQLLEESKRILETDSHVWIVCFRNLFQKTECNLLISKKKWKQINFIDNPYLILWKKYLQYKPYSENSELFTLNPWLRRTEQMKKIMFGYEDYVNEELVWERYKQLWLITINIPSCNHIWWLSLSTRFFKDGFFRSIFRMIKNGIKYYCNLIFKWKAKFD